MAYQFPLNGGRINASISGNTATAGINSLISTGTMVLSGGNNVTLSQTGNTIGISAANAPGGIAVAGNGATYSSGTAHFVGSGAISVSTGANQSFIFSSPATSSLQGAGAISVGTNGSTVSIAAPVQSNLSATGAVSIATNGNTISIGAPAQTAYSFASSNGVSFGTNGSVVTASVAAASGGVALSGGGTSFGSGTVNLSASGALVISSSTNGYNFGVPNTSSLAATGIASISTNGSTISVGAPAYSVGIATDNVSQITNKVLFAAGNNVTLSQSTGAGGGTISIGASAQTNQTLGIYGVGSTVSSSSGTLDARSLSFRGVGGASVGYSNGSVVISGATGGGGGIALAGSNTTYATGTVNLVGNGAVGVSSGANQSFIITSPNTSSIAGAGAITVGTNGNTISVGAPVQSNLSATGGASISTNGNTIYVGAPAANTGRHFDNMIQQTDVQALAFSSMGASFFNRLLLQPLSPGNELFPFNLTASTMLLNFSNSSTSTSLWSAAHSSSWYFGLYSRVNSTQLSLINSASTSYGLAANTGNSASYNGARWLSFHSTRFSAPLVFAEGSRYFYGVMARTAGATYPNQSIAGLHLGASVARSGMMAAAGAANTLNAWHPFMGVHNTTTFTALPATIANSQINKATQYANFMPQVILDGGLGQMT